MTLTIDIPALTFEAAAIGVPKFLHEDPPRTFIVHYGHGVVRKWVPKTPLTRDHTVLCHCGDRIGTGLTKAEAANAAIAAWSAHESARLAATAWEANHETIYE